MFNNIFSYKSIVGGKIIDTYIIILHPLRLQIGVYLLVQNMVRNYIIYFIEYNLWKSSGEEPSVNCDKRPE